MTMFDSIIILLKITGLGRVLPMDGYGASLDAGLFRLLTYTDDYESESRAAS
jgi:hypothetical protein